LRKAKPGSPKFETLAAPGAELRGCANVGGRIEQFCPVVIGTHRHDAGDIPLVVIGNRLRYETCVIAALVFAALALVKFFVW
jgi:hypothetical protein